MIVTVQREAQTSHGRANTHSSILCFTTGRKRLSSGTFNSQDATLPWFIARVSFLTWFKSGQRSKPLPMIPTMMAKKTAITLQLQ
mmetsp:Transcript_89867/g.164878  ORF Transcript_89867/g.164878 Transcript_89867/m.164878 type:complete len:85 (+) Transcript_89867:2-256(+)